jgi:hypothetical protein
MTRTPALLAVTAAALLTGGLFFASAQADDGDDVVEDMSDRDAQRAERDAERAQRDAHREAERAHREAERAQRDAHRVQRDAQRVARDQARSAMEVARQQIRAAREQISRDKNIPPQLRTSIMQRLDRTQRIMDQRIGRAVGAGDWDTFEAEMEKMGEEIEHTFEGFDQEMERFGQNMEAWGEKFGEEFGEKFGKELEEKLARRGFRGDVAIPPVPPVPAVPPVPGVHPAPPAPPAPPGPSAMPRSAIDMSDLDVRVDLRELSLTPAQRQALDRIVAEESRAVDAAEGTLDNLSEKLRKTLQNPDADEGEIARTVDAISAEEGKIRKARILAWAKTRKVLDDKQRARVERGRRGH